MENTINWVDWSIAAVFLLYALQGASTGFIGGFIEFVLYVISLTIGLILYPPIADLFLVLVPLQTPLVKPIVFLIAGISCYLGLRMVLFYLFPISSMTLSFGRSPMKRLNTLLGISMGGVSSYVALLFFLTLLTSLPISSFLNRSIATSVLGSKVLMSSQRFEKSLHQVSGRSLLSLLTFVTVSDKPTERLPLSFQSAFSSVDSLQEKGMMEAINVERGRWGLKPLLIDDQLVKIARGHGIDMVKRGYFSHYSLDGASPADRMVGIRVRAIGENLAIAPNSDLAMEGLMNSPSHRANILSTRFRKVGVGAISAGANGVVFVQEFTD